MFGQPATEQIRSVFLQCFSGGHFPGVSIPLWPYFPLVGLWLNLK